MKKSKIHIACLLFSAVLSAAVFYIAARCFFMFFWNFDLLSDRHWSHILEKWKDGWIIRKPKEVLFVIALLLLLPAYLFSWFLAYIFPWKKFFLFPVNYYEKRKKAKLQAQSLAAAAGPADKTAALAAKKDPSKALKLPAEKLKEIDRLRGKAATHIPAAAASHAPEAPLEKPAGTPAPKGPATMEEEAVARFNLWTKLAEALESRNIFIFREMKIGEYQVNIFAVTGEGLFMLCEGPALGNEWEVNENSETPSWKMDKGILASPLRPLIKARDTLKNYLAKEMPNYAGLSVNACLILDHGDITNADDMLPFLEEWDISVLRMGACRTASLPDTTALIEYIKAQPVSTQALNDAVAIAILDLMESENA